MTTDVIDSTVYPTSSTFFDSADLAESNPLAVKRDGFDFNAKHNGVGCIESLSPEDRGTENQFWFTTQMFVDIFCELRRTIERNIESLLADEEISMDKNVRTEKIPAMDGKSYQTTMYNLEVLNKLGMCCFRGNKKAKEIRNKFNDVLVKAETQTVPKVLPNFSNPAEAARAWADQYERAEEAKKALEAEQEAHEQDNRDYSEGLSILESKKAEIGSKREAKAMATASAKSRECARLAEENDELKDAVGRGANWRTVSMMKAEWVKEFGHTPVWQKLKQFSQDVCIDPVKDVEERVILKDGSEKVTIVNRYHREAWARYRKYEENLRVTDTEIFGV